MVAPVGFEPTVCGYGPHALPLGYRALMRAGLFPIKPGVTPLAPTVSSAGFEPATRRLGVGCTTNRATRTCPWTDLNRHPPA